MAHERHIGDDEDDTGTVLVGGNAPMAHDRREVGRELFTDIDNFLHHNDLLFPHELKALGLKRIRVPKAKSKAK